MARTQARRKQRERREVGGKRFYEGKLPLDLVDPEFEMELAQLHQYGGEKYGNPLNYQKGMPRALCIASALRHINAIRRGEEIDEESGIPHAVMAAWNMMALRFYQRKGIDIPDDRWEKLE